MNRQHPKTRNKKASLLFSVLFVILVAAFFYFDSEPTAPNTSTNHEASYTLEDTFSEQSSTEYDETESEVPIVLSYTFRKEAYLQEHYEKHGISMGFSSAEEYLSAANKVLGNPNVLHKLEAEDGDHVYYLEATNEFVVVSTDGYIRTYFYPEDGIDYFNKQ